MSAGTGPRRGASAAAAALLLLLLPAARPAPAADLPWWNDTVFYEIFVRSFADSDGDGVGDLPGLVGRLDYLNDADPATVDDLGVTGIWLMPITQSPSDHGYDVTDYRRVDDEYGTNEDLRTLVREAHRRGIHVIVDLVMNHTSSRHPWFVASRSGRESPLRDFYVWRDDDPGWKGPWGADAWHADSTGTYYGVFWGGMPDLNLRNAAVTDSLVAIARFWLEDLGVDGFRLDAIKHLVEEGSKQENTASTHAWLRDFHRAYRAFDPEALTVGEVWSPTEDVVPYLGAEVDLAFEFETAGSFLESARREVAAPACRALAQVTRLAPPQQFATFLANHDQSRVVDALQGSRDHARTAAALLLTGPGVPFLFYGEEIGQAGSKPDPNIRGPMQWSAGANAGFTAGPAAWRPPQSDYRTVNVAAESADPASLLSHYRRLIRLRNEHPELRRGTWDEVECSDPAVYACLRHHAGRSAIVLVNLSGRTAGDYRLTLAHGPLRGDDAVELLSGRAVAAPAVGEAGGFTGYTPLPLAPYATAVVELDRP